MTPAPRVLMLSLSRDLARAPDPRLNEDQRRQLTYAKLCAGVDIVVKTPDADEYAFRQLSENVRIHPARSSGRIGAAVRIWRLAWRLARSRRPDVIVTQDPFVLGLFGLLLARWNRAGLCVHYVCDFLDNAHWIAEHPLNRALNLLARFVLRRATAVRVDSRDEAEKLSALGVVRDAIHFIPFLQPGLEQFGRSAPAATKEGTVLFVARLEPQKGLDTLLDVIGSVRVERPETRFIIVGDGSQRSWFERELDVRGLVPAVEMAGWQPIDSLPAFFHRSDVFLLTSRYETSARVLQLADVAGLRVVTTEVSGARELLRDGRHAIAPVGDATALARHVVTALDARALHIEDASPAYASRDYSEENILRGFERLLAESAEGAAFAAETHLCYVLPKYAADTEEHFQHTYELLSELSRSAQLTVIVERSVGIPRFGSATVYRQRFAEWLPLRFAEVLWFVFRARLRGARTFYVHYSNVAVLACWLVTRVCGGRLCYWHCVSRFFRQRGHGLAAWRHRLSAEWPLAVTMGLVDVLVTGTESLARMYRATFRLHDVRVVPNEINPARFSAPAEAAARLRATLGLGDGPVVLFVHRLAPRKGALRLPALGRALAAGAPSAQLVIVGDGPSGPALREIFAADPMLAARVRFAGWVPNAQIAAYYAISDVLIMPSEEEGFPRVLLEAMAAGVPFVATDVGGVRDLSSPSQQSCIVPLDDEKGFAERVIALLQDPALRATLREDGLRHVARYAVPLVARRTLSELDIVPAGEGLTLAPREVSV